MTEDTLMTADELARRLRKSRRAIDRMRKAGNLGCIREINIGGEGKKAQPRFRETDVVRYLKEREV